MQLFHAHKICKQKELGNECRFGGSDKKTTNSEYGHGENTRQYPKAYLVYCSTDQTFLEQNHIPFAWEKKFKL